MTACDRRRCGWCYFINRLYFSVTCEIGMLFSIHSVIRSDWQKQCSLYVSACVCSYWSIREDFKLQYHTANCHHYKNTLCNFKCVKKNTKLNSPNNADRNMYSTAHIRRPYERKDESRWGLTFSRLMTYIYVCRTAPLTSRCYTLYIYSTNIRTEYFKHAAHSPFFPLQSTVYFIMLPFLVPVLFTF